MNIDKYFDKKLEISTKDKTYHIEKVQLFIHDSSSFCGEANILRKENGDILRIKEVYSLEKHRLRYLYDKFEGAKTYETIEKSEDGSTETPIMVYFLSSAKASFLVRLDSTGTPPYLICPFP